MRWLVAVFGLLCAGSGVASAGDLAAVEKVFRKCATCHAVGANAKNKLGPTLNGVVGREWGAIEGYKYSADREGTLLAIHEAEPKRWDVATLTAYLREPKDVIPNGKMPFAGLQKDEDIDNVIFYLAQFDSDGNEVDPAEVLSGVEKPAD
jgi:cytochrome c